jgi:NodT family efflux transporter outer membrane factor (OMF) lipoprotein
VSYLRPPSAIAVAIRLLCAPVVGTILSGCLVGPNYHRPPLAQNAGYIQNSKTSVTTTASKFESSQQFTSDQDVPARWWTEFNSPEIDRLVDQAVAKNPDLASAQAALRAAHATLAAQKSALFPQVAAGFSASRQRNSATLASPLNSNVDDYSLYTGQLNIIYAPDVFGGIHRQIETVEAQAENQKFAVEAAYLTLTSNVVVAAIQVGSLRAQIRADEGVIKADQEILDALRMRQRLGEASAGDVAAQDAIVAQAKTALPPLRKQLGQQEHLLAQLTGQTPAEYSEESVDLDTLSLPSKLPLSLPSILVNQRPDIRAAEANLHAASAQVGVAIANRLPNISLSAALGGASTDVGSLLSNGNALWFVTGGLTQPIFDAGALRGKQRAAEAQFDQAKAQYRSTVLSAFQNVADALLALNEDSAALAAGVEAEQSAGKSLDIARMRLRLGEGNSNAVLIAEQTYQQSLTSRTQAQAARYSDTVGLFQALGGGWWNRGDTDQISSEKAKTD